MNIIPLLRNAAFSALLLLLVGCTKELEPITTNAMTDPRDGRVYKTVTINGDTWFAENLVYLPFLTDFTGLAGEVQQFPLGPSYIYDYIGDNVEEAKLTWNYLNYGCLYWVRDHNVDSLCPEGWHISTDAEWARVLGLAGEGSAVTAKLKATYGWNDGKNGTDELGLGILPGGFYIEDGNTFQGNGISSCFATSSKKFTWYEGMPGRYPIIRSIADKVYTFANVSGYAASIRCVKD
jgi:uncharacterized protein (TIGR02145 family)